MKRLWSGLCVVTLLGVGCATNVGGEATPVAVIGPDGAVVVGADFILDGSGSFVPGRSSAALTYLWSIAVAPLTDGATLATPTEAKTTLQGSSPGLYVVRLVVGNGTQRSSPAYANVRVFREAQAPAASAGPDQQVEPGSLVTLDGAASMDPEGGTLRFAWIQTAGDAVALSDLSSVSPTFTAPRPAQTLSFSLTVTDPGGLESRPDTVLVAVRDLPPLAVITAPATGDEGGAVALDGTNSSDPNGDLGTAFSYAWTVNSNLGITLNDSTLARPSFTVPPFCGAEAVTVGLIVTVAGQSSVPVSTAIDLKDVLNEAPVADAGSDQIVGEGDAVALDGRASSDCNGDVLTYSWAQTTGPNVALSDLALATPSFTAPTVFVDTPLIFLLTVTDPGGLTGTATVIVTVRNTVNEPPVARAGSPRSVQVQSTVTLDGSGSSDPNGDSLLFTWTQTGGTSITLSNASAPQPAFVAPTAPTSLTFELVVDDGAILSAPSTVTITVNPAGPDPFSSTIVTADPALLADGAATTQVTVTVVDGVGNLLTGQPVVISTTAGTLLGSITDNANGTYTQLLRAPTQRGSTTLSFTIAGQTATATATVGFLPGPPVGVIVLNPVPVAIIANGSSTSTVTTNPIVDANGNQVTDGTLVTISTNLGTITTADADPGTPGLQVSTTGGVASFVLRSQVGVGTATIQANTVTGTASGSVTVPFVAGPAVTLTAFAAASPTLVADGAATTLVTGGPVLDAWGNQVPDGTLVTVSIDVNGAPASIPTNLDQDPVTPGVQVATSGGTFVVTVVAGVVAGTVTVNAASVQGTAAATTGILLVPGAAAGTITLAATPDPIVVTGTLSALPTSTTVSSGAITDANGNVVSDGTLVTVSANLGANITTPDADPGTNGIQVATLSGVITFSLDASTQAGTLTAAAAVAGASGNVAVTVEPGPATDLVYLSGNNQTGTVGQALGARFRVRAEDANGNPVPGVSVIFTVSAGGGGIVAPASVSTNALGVAGARGQLGAVAGTANNSYVATSGTLTGSPITFTASADPGPAANFTVTGHPSPSTAGTAQSVTITALDQFGNVATGYTGTVTFTSSDGAATLPGNTAFVSGDAGVITVSVTLQTAGLQSITATDTVSPSLTGSQSGIQVDPDVAQSFAVSGHPSPSTAGSAQNVTVTALDAFGNVATAYTGTATFSSSDPAAILPAPYTFLGGDAGITIISVELRTAGLQSVTATDTVAPSITGSQTNIQVNAAAADHLGMVVEPTTTVFNVPIAPAPEVEVLDAFGNRLTAGGPFNVVVAIGNDGSGTGSAVLAGTLTQATTAGVAVFPDLAIDLSGTAYTLVFSAAGVATGVTSATFDITCTLAASATALNTLLSTTAFPWDTIALDGSGSTTCGATVSYGWTVTVTALDGVANQVGGFAPWVALSTTASGAATTYYVEEPGTYVFTLTVLDGATPYTSTATINVVDFAQIPYGVANPAAVDTRAIALKASSGDLFLGTESGGMVYRPGGGEILTFQCLSSTQGRVVAISPGGVPHYGFANNRVINKITNPIACIANAGGVTVLDPGGVATTDPGKSRRLLFAGAGEGFYLGTNRDIFYCDAISSCGNAGAGWSEYWYATPTADTEYRALSVDHDGDYWFGPWRGSPGDRTVKTPDPAVETMTLDIVTGGIRDRPSVFVRGVFVPATLDEMWVGTDANGIAYYADAATASSGGATFFNLAGGDLDSDKVLDGLLEDGTADLWFVTDTGINRYKRDVGAFANIAMGGSGLPPNGGGVQPWALVIDEGNARGRILYIATGSAGVYRIVAP